MVKRRLSVGFCGTKIGKDDEKPASNKSPADFETALEAVGFGKFNILLLLSAVPATWTIQFESTLMSYVSPVAECDLNLSLQDKGILNSMTLFGMVLTSFFWGFMLDTVGRKKVLCVGFFIHGLIVITSSLSQSFVPLAMAKFFGGSIAGGLHAAIIAYTSEFHTKHYRNKIQMLLASFYGLAGIMIPLVSFYVLPLPLHIRIIDYLDFHAWNMLILCSSFGGFLSAAIFFFADESPKFLMTQGKTEEALQVFRKCYSRNTGMPEDEYPIVALEQEVVENKSKLSVLEHIKKGMAQTAPLFSRKFAPKLALVCMIEGLFQTSNVTLRLWVPQIFQSIHDYQASHGGRTDSLCTMLKVLKPKIQENGSICSVNTEDNFEVYLNSIIIACTQVTGFALTALVINKFGRKTLLIILGPLASVAVMCIYLSTTSTTTLALIAVNISSISVCFDVMMTLIVILFPTSLRAMAISLTMAFGRSLAVTGTIVFPYLLQMGCAPPFFTLGSLLIVSSSLCLLLPSTDNKDLK